MNLESGVPDGLHCCQCSLRLAGNAQAAFAQLETQPQDTRDALDSATDLGLLAGTVHRRNPEALATTRRCGHGSDGRVFRGATAWATRGRWRRAGPIRLDVMGVIVSHVAIENPEVGIESRGVVNLHWHKGNRTTKPARGSSQAIARSVFSVEAVAAYC